MWVFRIQSVRIIKCNSSTLKCGWAFSLFGWISSFFRMRLNVHFHLLCSCLFSRPIFGHLFLFAFVHNFCSMLNSNYKCVPLTTLGFILFIFFLKIWYCDSITRDSYREICDGNFKGVLWIFKKWLALKMQKHYGISIVLLLTSAYDAFFGYLYTSKKNFELPVILSSSCNSWIHEEPQATTVSALKFADLGEAQPTSDSGRIGPK